MELKQSTEEKRKVNEDLMVEEKQWRNPRYSLKLCRQCFREYSKDIAFKKLD